MAVKELARLQFDRVSFGTDRMRKSAVKIIPEHDGFYRVISLFEEEAGEQESAGQLILFKG